MKISPLEFKFIQKTVYFGLQFCYLVRKFCIQIWNSVSDTVKSLYAQISANLEKFGLATLLLAPILHLAFNYALILVFNIHLLSLKHGTRKRSFSREQQKDSVTLSFDSVTNYCARHRNVRNVNSYILQEKMCQFPGVESTFVLFVDISLLITQNT